MLRNTLISVLVLFCFSCKPKAESSNTDLLYFDLAGYFKKESARLKLLNPTVNKTVSVNGNNEKQSLKINDWENELAIFSNADINKNAWRGLFETSKNNNLTIYTSNNKKVNVKQVVIKTLNNHVDKIEIIISNRNLLYSSHDTLTYLPNQYYKIKKQQNIKLLESKNYQIIGEFH